MSPVRPAGWKRKVFEAEPMLRPEARIRRQVDGIERCLGLKFRNRVLDLGCGAGSQTLELARRKYRVVGMDGTSEAFALAREQAKTENLTVHFLANDLRRIPYEAEFNAVINLRNPIGCYKSERDDLRTLEAIRKSLRPGGRVLLDLLNREWLIRRLGTQGQPFDLKTGRLDCRGFSPRGARPSYMGDTLRIYSLTEITRLLQEAGFHMLEAWGDYDGRHYGIDTQRLIVAAERLPDPKKAPRVDDEGLARAVRIKGRPR